MRRLAAFSLAAFALVVLSGCAKKFTRENFNLISEGVDDRYDVQKRIGPPYTTFGDSDEWYFQDEDAHYSAIVHFNDQTGKVNGKEWIDGLRGEFSGHNPHADAPPEGEVRESRTKTRTVE